MQHPLKIKLTSCEFFDGRNNSFITYPEIDLELEHSLYSISRWEQLYGLPYFNVKPKTTEEILSYIACMSTGNILDVTTISRLGREHIELIQKYMDAPMTGTTFVEDVIEPTKKKQIITNELLYAQMFELRIDLSCEHWHFNRLSTLLRVCQSRLTPPKKLSKKQIAAKQHAENKRRQAMYNTRG